MAILVGLLTGVLALGLLTTSTLISLRRRFRNHDARFRDLPERLRVGLGENRDASGAYSMIGHLQLHYTTRHYQILSIVNYDADGKVIGATA
jgi:hypothetical protein